jgi:hypothetical protein
MEPRLSLPYLISWLFGLFGRLGYPPVGFGSRLSLCLRLLEHDSSAGLVQSIGSSVCFFVGISLRGLWLPARSIPAVDFLAGPVFGFSFHAGERTTLLRVGSPADSPLQL